MARNDGTLLERKLHEALKAYCARNLALCYRFPDTKAARNLMASQPGDFMFILPGTAILIECKSTNCGRSLRALIDTQQVACHRKWHRAGHPTCWVWGDTETGVVEAHAGAAIVQQVVHNKRLPSLVATATLQTLDQLIADLVAYHTKPVQTQEAAA